MATIELSGVRKAYGATPVIHGVDLAIRDGEFVVFVGPSGCGKSTLLRMIAGLEDITGGEIRIDGRVVNAEPPAQRGLAMVFQSYALYPHMSVRQNLSFGLENLRMPRAEIERRVADAARMLQIDVLLERKPRQLSGGQRQRVAIGRAIVREPRAFLFDEPLSNLDAKLRQDMRLEIKRLHQRLGATMIYVTHDQVEAMTMADRIVVLNGGRIEQVGPPRALYRDPATRFVAGFIGAPPMNMIPVAMATGQATLPGGAIVAVATPAGAAGSAVLGIRPEHLVRDPSGFAATVELVEPLGADTLVSARLGGGETMVTARLPGDAEIPIGATLRLGFDPHDAVLLDPETGARLRA
ncbi:MAG: sn-glycerol-3-phosphate ABC transporter ATP-binding protein UgpC [Alphaproteobacteria bacterium]|nr:sn-glycerol-3-phosphate ABC transporter ATP-binding protein UgpC [Alphaproteobacteria bacterium]